MVTETSSGLLPNPEPASVTTAPLGPEGKKQRGRRGIERKVTHELNELKS